MNHDRDPFSPSKQTLYQNRESIAIRTLPRIPALPAQTNTFNPVSALWLTNVRVSSRANVLRACTRRPVIYRKDQVLTSAFSQAVWHENHSFTYMARSLFQVSFSGQIQINGRIIGN
jgi:hypothetical protein